MKFDLLAFGSLTLDTFVDPAETKILQDEQGRDVMQFEVGAKIPMKTLAKHVGGSAANISTGMAALSFKAGVYGTVGDDEAGRVIRHLLEWRNVDVAGLSEQEETASSSSIILMAPDGRRTVWHERTTHAHFECFPGCVPETRAIHIGHLDVREESLFEHLGDWKSDEHLIFWNPGKTQFKKGFAAFAHVYPFVDSMIINKEELALFAGEAGEVKVLARKFIEAGVKQLVVTDGNVGAYLFTKNEEVFQATMDERKPVCTLGAGDAFSVGVAAAKLLGHDGATQLMWGTRNAESVIREFGAQVGQMGRKEIERQ